MDIIELRPYGYGQEEDTLRFKVDLKALTFETTLLDPQGQVMVHSRLAYEYRTHFFKLLHGLDKSARHCLRTYAPHVHRQLTFGPCTSIIFGAHDHYEAFLHEMVLYLDRAGEPHLCDKIHLELPQKELKRFQAFFEEMGKELEKLA